MAHSAWGYPQLKILYQQETNSPPDIYTLVRRRPEPDRNYGTSQERRGTPKVLVGTMRPIPNVFHGDAALHRNVAQHGNHNKTNTYISL